MKTALLILVAIVLLLAAGFVVLRNRYKQVKSQDGTFSVLQGNVDGRPMVAMIDMGLRNYPDKQAMPFFLSLSTPLINPTSEGLPTRSDSDSLNAWEDAAEAQLRSGGRFVYVGRVTWNGHRELLYYLDNQQPYVDALRNLSDGHSTRSFAFICERDEKWTKTDVWLNRR
jgi:Family of unknown function (DUF695)